MSKTDSSLSLLDSTKVREAKNKVTQHAHGWGGGRTGRMPASTADSHTVLTTNQALLRCKCWLT